MLGWLFFLTLLALVFIFWNRQQRATQLTLQAVRRHCSEEDLQLLDDTLELTGMRFRNGPGGWKLHRNYRFEFSSTGQERYQGRVILAGRRIIGLRLDAHRIH
ncbi:DUF3301 domain-containing protein [Thalassolituus sp. LLYu03]|uniref:DUF3301 domain-containing protein n=1 Tax=Thalassolituus sp. LLYu03 TaxID=3421656 RepID=UPI003D2D296D